MGAAFWELKDAKNNGGNNTGGNDSYESVTIGGKTWMKKNLNIETADSWCYGEGGQVYDDNDDKYKTLSSSEIQAYCNKYGRLYTWAAAKTACPKGWRLPSRDEWGALAKAAGGTDTYGDGGTAGKALKSTSGWYDNGNGTDDFGLSALPGGYRLPDGSFFTAGYGGLWWTATENYSADAYLRGMYYKYDYVYEYGYDKSYGFSVLCVQDP
jgi:uncharacterized protein (TIGR02145 family)